MELTAREADELKMMIVQLEREKKKYPVRSKQRSEAEKNIALYRCLLQEIRENDYSLIIN